MADRAAIFIDGAYLDYMLRDEFSDARIDLQKLTLAMAGDADILRTYYYHCPPYQGNPPTLEERTRYAAKRSFFTALERLPRFAVRLGRLEKRGVPPNVRYEQKRVDILLCVDLVHLAAKSQIQQAILLAGDSDFIPAVVAAKSDGVLVRLFHGDRPHTDLWQEADDRIRINQSLVDSVLRSS
ncbi:MAG: NYN domain-containing protein [Chloroflexi bacterium]|nr:NYN domain-containing protein [Chloroflexota bacterium]